MSIRIEVIVVSIGCLLLSACGGGSDSPKNSPPTTSNLSLATTEDTPLQGIFGASDADGDPLTAAIVTQPGKGTVSISSTNPLSFTYTPGANLNGSDSFTYTVSDGKAASSPATVDVAITAINDPPVIQNQIVTDEDTPLSAQIVTEVDGETFSMQIVAPPRHGSLTLDPVTPGKITYAPNANFNGADSFQVIATDSSSTVSTAVVQITVRPVNDAPVANADNARTVQGRSVNINVLANDTDVDGDLLTAVPGTPTNGTALANPDGSIQYTPTASFVGTASFTYQARDPTGATSTATVTVKVGLTSAVVFQGQETGSTSSDIFFADGLTTAKVNAPLANGERVVSVKLATTDSVVYYVTLNGTINNLHAVDLHHASQVIDITHATAWPGVGEYTISANGSKVAYTMDGRLRFVDLSNLNVVRDLAPARLGPFMNLAGTRVFYTDLQYTPTLQPSALYAVDTAGTAAPVAVSQIFNPPDSVNSIAYLTKDEHHLYYRGFVSGSEQWLAVDPQVPGTDITIISGLEFKFVSANESLLIGRLLVGGVGEDYYAIRASDPGTSIKLTGGSGNGGVSNYALSDDASKFYYSRTDSISHGVLYQVDLATPTVSKPIGQNSPSKYGVYTLSLSHDDTKLVYSTLDQISLSGGIFTAGAGDIYSLNLQAPQSPTLVKHFGGLSQVGPSASDDTFVIFYGAEQLAVPRVSLYILNMRDPTQQIELFTAGSLSNVVGLLPSP